MGPTNQTGVMYSHYVLVEKTSIAQLDGTLFDQLIPVEKVHSHYLNIYCPVYSTSNSRLKLINNTVVVPFNTVCICMIPS